MEKIDFATIKEAVPVEAAARFLGLDLKQHADTFRCACPQCQEGGGRAIVITPAKRAWYCFALKKGGDVIYLVAHIKGIKQSEAANLLQAQFMREPEKPKSRKSGQRKKAPDQKALKAVAGGTEEYSILDHLQHWA